MTVAGQNAVSYGWDSANRLTGITQDRVLVGFYDNANRRTSLALPTGSRWPMLTTVIRR